MMSLIRGVSNTSCSTKGKRSQCAPGRKLSVRVEAESLHEASTSKPQSARKLIFTPETTPNVDRRAVLGGGLATMTGLACPCCTPSPAQAAGWTYSAESGPGSWPAVCGYGKTQSPIDLQSNTLQVVTQGASGKRKLSNWQFAYKSETKVRVLNTGHGTPQVNFFAGNLAVFNGDPLQLLQFHYHNPSEHTVDGKHFPAEVHLVHVNLNTGKLHVVGVMIEEAFNAPYNKCLQVALDSARDSRITTTKLLVSANDLLPPTNYVGRRPFIHYSGSLTTPPCSEGVDWCVMTIPLYIPKAQMAQLQEYHVDNKNSVTGNARPTQGLYGRGLEYIA